MTSDTAATVPVRSPREARTVAEALLVHLRRRGVDRLFVNAGTDFAPLVEAYARCKESGLDLPDVVVCAHENLAVGMAHGCHLGDGRVPAVMLHTSVGTANAVCAVLNAARSRIPLLLAAGRTPLFERGPLGARDYPIHWAQEMYDQAGMLREAVKWDYELRDGGQLADVVDRGLDIAATEPRGPVYLTLPREVLAAPAADVAEPPPVPVPTPAHPDPAALDALVEHLVSARLPVFVVADTGADRAAFDALDRLAERFAIGVVESGAKQVNLRADHPMHLGHQLTRVPGVDVLCVLDVDVPWLPAGEPDPATVVVQCGPDPHFRDYPVRTHRSDLSLTSGIRPLLDALLAAMAARAGEIDPARAERVRAAGQPWRARRAAVLESAAAPEGPITKDVLNAVLARVRPADAVVVDEYWAAPELLGFTEPGTYLGTPPAGGLGWGLPAAMGLQLARPGATVIAALGDGAYLFANPAACHQAMAMHDLPVLTVVCRNGRWGAVQGSAVAMYPDGHAATAPDLSPLARLDPVPDLALYAVASGGAGLRVRTRAELEPALREALRVVREERRHALVDVECA
jgi:acetolactate synthase-1/2/3 large subunit